MANRSVGAQIRDGFRLTCKVLLMLGWFGLVLAGLAEGLGFGSGGRNRPLLGLAILAVAAVIFLWTMERWIIAFPGLVALATLNAFAAVITGHAAGDISTPLAPRDAAIYTALLAVSTIVSFRFTKRRLKLRILDRVAVVGFVFCIFWSAVDKRVQIIAPGMACGRRCDRAYFAVRSLRLCTIWDGLGSGEGHSSR
jgi:hypothetical protein